MWSSHDWKRQAIILTKSASIKPPLLRLKYSRESLVFQDFNWKDPKNSFYQRLHEIVVSETMCSPASQGELLALVARITAAAEGLDAVKPYEASKARESLLRECERLIASLQDPYTAVWPRAFQVNVAVSIDIAATLGIWESLRSKKFVTLSEILSDTDADPGTTGPLALNMIPWSSPVNSLMSQSESCGN